jgi:IS5 family transposase
LGAANPQISFADWELMRRRLLLEPVLQAIADFFDDHEEIIETIRGASRGGSEERGHCPSGIDCAAGSAFADCDARRELGLSRDERERIADDYPRARTEFHGEPVPKQDAFQRTFARLTLQTLMAVDELLVQAAVALGLEDGKTLRVDTTVGGPRSIIRPITRCYGMSCAWSLASSASSRT